MAQNVILKRKTGLPSPNDVEILHPETTISQVKNFLSNGKIPIIYFPEGQLSPGTLVFMETITTGDLSATWFDLRFDSPGGYPKKGAFYIAVNTVTLPAIGALTDGGTGLKYDISYVVKDDGDNNLSLEKGDWLIINNLTWTGNANDTLYIQFAIINNTYSAASTSVPGVVTLGSVTTITGLSGNNVVTQANLKTMFSEKQAVNSRLTNIGSIGAPDSGKKVSLSLTNDGAIGSTAIYTSGSVSLATLVSTYSTEIMTGAALTSLLGNEVRIHDGTWDAHAKTNDILIEDV